MIRIIRTVIVGILLFVGILPAYAREYSPSDVPNVQQQDRNRFVSDPDKILSEDTRSAIDRKLRAFTDSTTAELAVVILESIGNYDSAKFSQELFDKWGIGKRDKDNGILLLIAMESHEARIHTGYGVEGALPDIVAMGILRSELFPKMREGDVDGAVSETVDKICEVLTDPNVAKEILSKQKSSGNQVEPIDKHALLYAMLFIASVILLCSIIVLIISFTKSRKLDDYHKSIYLRNTTNTMLWLSLLSVGAALPLALVAWLSARKVRNKPRKCRRCGSMMTKLSEEADNAYLTPSQDFEEKLQSVDYDVWLCPRCDCREIFSYKSSKSSYRECPSCHTRALRHVGSKTIQAPSTISSGIGERIYECKYCKYTKAERYTIPKIVVPVVTGSGGRGGGGFSGGGFGGGRSGGGGAGGHW